MVRRRALAAVTAALAAPAALLLLLSPAAAAGTGARQAAAAAGVACLRMAVPPDPPPGGVVLAGPLDPNSFAFNVVELLNGAEWYSGECGTGGAAVIAHPTTVTVAPGAALLLEDDASYGVPYYSAWGAVNVTPADPAPVWAPGAAHWTTTAVSDTDAYTLLDDYDSCRDCVITDAQLPPLLKPNKPTFYVADLSGANLSGDTLSGYMEGYDLTRTNLSGATLDADLNYATLSHTIVDGSAFGSSSLLGTQLSDLQHGAATPPSFDGVEIGMTPRAGKCTTFSDTDLVGAVLAPASVVAGCKASPLLPGSTASLTVVKQVMAAANARGNVDLGDATYFSDSADRTSLAGADLHGVILDHAAFVGDPADFTGTDFDDASLAGTDFTLADFAGASFRDATATQASFREADLAASGTMPGANFSSSAADAQTNLEHADFADADISGAQFVGANLTSAVFSHVLAVNTNFNGVTAAHTDFSGAHIYGNGQAFDHATDLTGAAFSQAVLAGDTGTGTGLDLTGTDLTNATFSGTQCIHCDFTGSTLTGVKFDDAYLPGAVFSGAKLSGASFDDAWLYCGDLSNSQCTAAGPSEWSWPLALGSGEIYGPVPFPATNLSGVSLDDVAACPDGKAGVTAPAGCGQGNLLPDPAQAPPIPAACSAAALEACPTPTSTLFSTTSAAAPISVTPVVPPTWSTTLSGSGYYIGLTDGTIRQTATNKIVAGRPGQHCTPATAACGDGGPATSALLGTPSGLAVGLDGSLYVADSDTHRVRKIDPSGTITTIAGTGAACTATTIPACGDGGPATAATLNGPYGVWADPSGEVFIADGTEGVREVALDGTITAVGSGLAGYDVTSVAGDNAGHLYVTTDGPDYLLEIDLATGTVTKVVGTGTSGYDGDTDEYGDFLPGTQVQVNDPRSVSIATNGDVVFADTGNSLIRAYVPASGAVIDLAGLVSDSGVPESGYNGDDNSASQTELNHPLSVTVTTGALMIVADTGNSRVRQIGPNPLAPSSLGLSRGISHANDVT